MQALSACGGKNVFGSVGLLAPQVSIEAVVQARPEVIVVASPRDTPEVVKFWEGKRALFGAHFPTILSVDGEKLHRPTPRMLPAARAMCEALQSLERR
jgi:hypothetical protein